MHVQSGNVLEMAILENNIPLVQLCIENGVDINGDKVRVHCMQASQLVNYNGLY